MNEKWFDECSVVAYPHEIRFLNIDGGSMSYCVDRHVSEYVSKIQAQLNTLQNENRDKDIKNMILQSKIDKANEILDKLCIYGYKQAKCRPIKNTTKQEVYNAVYEIKEILREDK